MALQQLATVGSPAGARTGRIALKPSSPMLPCYVRQLRLAEASRQHSISSGRDDLDFLKK